MVQHQITQSIKQRHAHGQQVGEVVIRDGFGSAVHPIFVLDDPYAASQILDAGNGHQ
ncbi:hypothetical protein D3C71_1106570 [compost metagenome]